MIKSFMQIRDVAHFTQESLFNTQYKEIMALKIAYLMFLTPNNKRKEYCCRTRGGHVLAKAINIKHCIHMHRTYRITMMIILNFWKITS